MTTRFELDRTASGRYTFRLRGPDDAVAMMSGEYDTREAALRDLQLARRNVTQVQQLDLRVTHAGKYYFMLRAGARRGLAMSPLHATMRDMERGVAFVREHAADAPLVDRTADATGEGAGAPTKTEPPPAGPREAATAAGQTSQPAQPPHRRSAAPRVAAAVGSVRTAGSGTMPPARLAA